MQEITKFHSETDAALPAFYTSAFIFAMNKARYDALPTDLKKVIDANSGQALSGEVGKAFVEAVVIGKKTIAANTSMSSRRRSSKAGSSWGNRLPMAGCPMCPPRVRTASSSMTARRR